VSRVDTSACDRTRFARYEIMSVSCSEIESILPHRQNLKETPRTCKCELNRPSNRPLSSPSVAILSVSSRYRPILMSPSVSPASTGWMYACTRSIIERTSCSDAPSFCKSVRVAVVCVSEAAAVLRRCTRRWSQ
jgi:hypothetical protein